MRPPDRPAHGGHQLHLLAHPAAVGAARRSRKHDCPPGHTTGFNSSNLRHATGNGRRTRSEPAAGTALRGPSSPLPHRLRFPDLSAP